MRLHRPSPALLVAFTALVAATGGAAIATVPARDGDVHFCYSKRTGAVEVVNTQIDRFACEQNWRGFIVDSRPSALVSPNGQNRIEATDEGGVAMSVGDRFAVRLSRQGVFTVTSKTSTITGEDKADTVTGDASVRMRKDGTIDISGKDVTINASGRMQVQAAGDVTIKGSKVGGN